MTIWSAPPRSTGRAVARVRLTGSYVEVDRVPCKLAPDVDPLDDRNSAGWDRYVDPRYQTMCAMCGGPASAQYGPTLFCWTCLEPYVTKGEASRPSIQVTRRA